MAALDLSRKYRFYIKVDHDLEYHVFETRYYAQKYLDEVYLNSPHLLGIFEFEIKKADDGFVIYEKEVRVI